VQVSFTRAFSIHRALVIGAIAVMIFALGMTLERRRLIAELEDDIRSLSGVLNHADLVIEALRSYLITRERDGDTGKALARLLADTDEARRKADLVSARLVGRPGLPTDRIIAINRRLDAVKQTTDAIDARLVLYRPGTIAPTADLRTLTLRDLSVLARYAELQPERWLPAFLRYLADEPKNPRGAAEALLASLGTLPGPAGATAAPAILLDRLRERADAFAPYSAGTAQSTYAQSADGLKDLITRRRATRQTLEGYYDITVPEVGVSVPMRLLLLLAPGLATFVFLVVVSSLLTAQRALALLSASERDELELACAYDPAWFDPSGSPRATAVQWVAALGIWFAIPLAALGLLWFLYRPLLGSAEPWYGALAALAGALAIAGFLLTRALARRLA
jgi:hypothetical protein